MKWQSLSQRSKLIIISVVFVIITAGIITLIAFMWPKQNSSNNGTTDIKGYSSQVKNLSSDERNVIQSALAEVIKLNSNTNPTSVKDIVIRDNSYKQSFNDDTNLYTTSFIVDIPSLKQSYRISDDAYSSSSNYTMQYDYATTALCVKKSELKYGDFKCKDRLSVENDLPYSDEAEDVLPHNDAYFTARLDGYNKNNGKINISILLMVDSSNPDSAAIADFYRI